jgi:hypothetical protein
LFCNGPNFRNRSTLQLEGDRVSSHKSAVGSSSPKHTESAGHIGGARRQSREESGHHHCHGDSSHRTPEKRVRCATCSPPPRPRQLHERRSGGTSPPPKLSWPGRVDLLQT